MIRKARMTEVPLIYKTLEISARNGELLPRSLGELYDSIRDFQVYIDEQGQLRGCCALHPTWEDLGEIRSLVVSEEARKKGIGRSLVNRCLEEGRELDLQRIFVLTFNSSFFQRLQFVPISKSLLPHKIWAECIRCIHFPDCKEEALMLELREDSSE
jgi:amino-acid N-acetyltransferase